MGGKHTHYIPIRQACSINREGGYFLKRGRKVPRRRKGELVACCEVKLFQQRGGGEGGEGTYPRYINQTIGYVGSDNRTTPRRTWGGVHSRRIGNGKVDSGGPLCKKGVTERQRRGEKRRISASDVERGREAASGNANTHKKGGSNQGYLSISLAGRRSLKPGTKSMKGERERGQ